MKKILPLIFAALAFAEGAAGDGIVIAPKPIDRDPVLPPGNDPATPGPDAEFVLVRDGEAFPAGVVATPSQLAAANAQAASAIAAAAGAAAQAAAAVDAIGAAEGVGYVRGFATSFVAALAPSSSNMTAQIIRYDHAVASAGGMTTSDIYVWFSAPPANLPALEWRATLDSGSGWSLLETEPAEPATIEIDGEARDCFKIAARMPDTLASAFFRAFAEVAAGGPARYLPVRNGISVNGKNGITGEWTAGTNTIKFLGGIRIK